MDIPKDFRDGINNLTKLLNLLEELGVGFLPEDGIIIVTRKRNDNKLEILGAITEGNMEQTSEWHYVSKSELEEL